MYVTIKCDIPLSIKPTTLIFDNSLIRVPEENAEHKQNYQIK